ncbi:hypothetical protein GCM10010517_79180 [Streptosporangium fragile]|uniref:Uncharacterized protein n=2 Tax=Streptosporangium fragile TaxID=46186 RepID=A0ABN3WFZ3_9ACTN
MSQAWNPAPSRRGMTEGPAVVAGHSGEQNGEEQDGDDLALPGAVERKGSEEEAEGGQVEPPAAGVLGGGSADAIEAIELVRVDHRASRFAVQTFPAAQGPGARFAMQTVQSHVRRREFPHSQRVHDFLTHQAKPAGSQIPDVMMFRTHVDVRQR